MSISRTQGANALFQPSLTCMTNVTMELESIFKMGCMDCVWVLYKTCFQKWIRVWVENTYLKRIGSEFGFMCQYIFGYVTL